MPVKPNDFAPIPRQRSKPKNTAELRDRQAKGGRKGGKAKGQRKARGDKAYYIALGNLAERARQAKLLAQQTESN